MVDTVDTAPSPLADDADEQEDARPVSDLLELLGPALAIQIALAAMPKAGDIADGVVDVGDDMLDASEEIVAEISEEIPGGGAVRQVWAVAVMPGRFGVKVATTVLRGRKPPGS